MIPAAAPFLILFQNNAPKGSANCNYYKKIPSQWKPMCILKQNFIDGIVKIMSKKIPIF
jgi:hypothetical protein